jgi:hypothetical protein
MESEWQVNNYLYSAAQILCYYIIGYSQKYLFNYYAIALKEWASGFEIIQNIVPTYLSGS